MRSDETVVLDGLPWLHRWSFTLLSLLSFIFIDVVICISLFVGMSLTWMISFWPVVFYKTGIG